MFVKYFYPTKWVSEIELRGKKQFGLILLGADKIKNQALWQMDYLQQEISNNLGSGGTCL